MKNANEIVKLIKEIKKVKVLNTKGCVNLATGIIYQAILDYKALVKAKIIKGNKIIGDFKKGQRILSMRNVSEANRLIHWLKSDEMEKWIDIAYLDIDANKIRKELGLI